MSATAMAKKTGRPKGDRDDVTTRLPRALASRANTIAKYRGIPVAELLADIIEKPLNKLFAEMLREMESPAE